MRIIHLPTTVGGNPQGISRSLRKLSIYSETLALSQNHFNYEADKIIYSPRDNYIIKLFKKILALTYLFRYDIVFFNFGTTLFEAYPAKLKPNNHLTLGLVEYFYFAFSTLLAKLELFILKLRKVPIFVQYQGDDARQGDFCRDNFDITFANHVDDSYYNKNSDNAKRRRIKLITSYASKVYALNPDLLHVLPKSAEFLPYSHIDLSEWVPQYTQLEDRPLRIAHAPSHRGVKGTDLILDAVNKLRAKSIQFDFILIEGMSHSQAKTIYESVDIIVDQLFAGWYGGLAVEAMALGKPVIAYLRDNDLKYLPTDMREEIPIIQARPNTIYQVLEDVISMPRSGLLEISQKSRAYVERWHNPLIIAERLMFDMQEALQRKNKCVEY